MTQKHISETYENVQYALKCISIGERREQIQGL